MKRAVFSLLSIITLVLIALPDASLLAIAGEEETVDQIVISPDDAIIKGDGEESQAYTAEAFDA